MLGPADLPLIIQRVQRGSFFLRNYSIVALFCCRHLSSSPGGPTESQSEVLQIRSFENKAMVCHGDEAT